MSQLAIYNPNPLTPYAPRAQGDYYPTNPAVIRAGVEQFLPARNYEEIIEPGAGNNAPFLQVLHDVFPDAWRYGVEERDPIQPEHLKTDPRSLWFPRTHFIRGFNPAGGFSDFFDLVATNPRSGIVGNRIKSEKTRHTKQLRGLLGKCHLDQIANLEPTRRRSYSSL